MASFLTVRFKYNCVYRILETLIFDTQNASLICDLQPVLHKMGYAHERILKAQKYHTQMHLLDDRLERIQRHLDGTDQTIERCILNPFWNQWQVFAGIQHAFMEVTTAHSSVADVILCEILLEIQNVINLHRAQLDHSVPES